MRIPEPVRQVIRQLEEHGYQAWLVGGCVRDLLRQVLPADFDIATDATPDQTVQIFEHHALTGYDHGTVTVFSRKMAVEVTTFRSESGYQDRRRPDKVMYHASIEQDLARRDFTINSMAYHSQQGLLDPYHGLADLDQQVLRCVGEAEQRFAEDALRLLRAIRFALSLDLCPEPGLLQAAAHKADLIRHLSCERIWSELKRIMTADWPQRLAAFSATGILRVTFDHLLQIDRDDRYLYSMLGDYISLCRNTEQPMPLILTALSFSSGQTPAENLKKWADRSVRQAMARTLVRHSRLSRREASLTLAQLYWISLLLLIKQTNMIEDQCLRLAARLLVRQFRLQPDDACNLILDASQLGQLLTGGRQSLFTTALAWIDPAERPAWSITDLALQGHDLLAMGLQPGPDMQMVLERMLSLVIHHPEKNCFDYLAEWIRLQQGHISRQPDPG